MTPIVRSSGTTSNSYNRALASKWHDAAMPDALTTYRTVTPYLVVPSGDEELRFLTAAFGATETLCHRNEDNSVMHAEISIGDSLIMLGQAGGNWKALPAAL